jgi:DNA-binding winged helix-turn-helix (wHTH) protein
MVESQLELATLSEEPVEQEEESGLVYDLDLAVLLGEQDEDVARDRPAKEEEPAQKVLAQPAPSEAPALSAGAGEKSPVAAPGGELAEPVETAPLQEQAVPPETTAAQPTETGAAPPAPAAPRMRLNGFGVPTLLVEGSEVAQGQNLGLELLLLLAHSALQKQPSGAEYVSRYTIIDACLPASPQQDARGLASLRTAKYEFLRQVKPQGVAEHELFETGPNNGLRLNPAVSTYLADFMERALLLVQERQAIKAAPEEARAHLRRVKGLLEDLPALYRDGFGRGLSPKRWIADARKHYEGRYRLALTDGAQCLRLLGQTPQAIELATTVLHMEPENVKLVKAVLHWLESQEVGER